MTKGRQVNLKCDRCGKIFSKSACQIRPEQKSFLCSRECMKKTLEEKLATIKKCKKRWNDANKDRIAKTSKEWRDGDPERIKNYKKKYWKKHGEKILKKQVEFRKSYPEIVHAQDRINSKKYRDRMIKSCRMHYEKNSEKYTNMAQEYRKNYRYKAILTRVKATCKKKNLKYDLTHDWIKSRLDAGVCEMSGLPFDMGGKRTSNSPSLDRIKPGGDYTQDNTRMILWSLNHALSNRGEDYVLNVFRQIFIKRGEMSPK